MEVTTSVDELLGAATTQLLASRREQRPGDVKTIVEILTDAGVDPAENSRAFGHLVVVALGYRNRHGADSHHIFGKPPRDRDAFDDYAGVGEYIGEVLQMTDLSGARNIADVMRSLGYEKPDETGPSSTGHDRGARLGF